MKSQNNSQSPHEKLLRLFLDEYPSTCKHMDASCHEGLRDIAPLVFAKWYYTTLSTDTLLSPANIIWQDMSQSGTQDFTAYTMEIKKGNKGLKQYEILPITYSLEQHPLIEDLRIITDFSFPDREMDEHLFFLEEDRSFLLSQLSQKYDFYLEYLTRLAWWMGLFVHLPAIHTKKIQRAPACDDFFGDTSQNRLTQAATAACELAAERFSFSMDLDHGIASPGFFKECLTYPHETDQIFIDFYNQVHVDIEEIWQTTSEELSEEEEAIISSFLFTGIMLDKWFLFPMSAFFGLINPIGLAPLRYPPLVNNLAALITMEHNIGSEIFAPPSFYNLTPLGETLFGDGRKGDAKYEMPQGLSFTEILNAIKKELQILRFEDIFYMGADQDIFSLKIFRRDQPSLWKIIEAGSNTLADEFCRDLCSAFATEDVYDYVLSIPDENNFPVDYSPQGSKRSINKTNERTLGDLWTQEGLIMTLSPTMEKSRTLVVEVLAIKESNPHILYPRVCAQSPEITALEKIDEIF